MAVGASMRVRGAESALKAVLAQPLIGMTYRQERQIPLPGAPRFGMLAVPLATAAAIAAVGSQ